MKKGLFTELVDETGINYSVVKCWIPEDMKNEVQVVLDKNNIKWQRFLAKMIEVGVNELKQCGK